MTRTPQCLTVLASIRPDREAGLRELLRAIGDDINGKDLAAGRTRPHIAFVRSRRIHFARLAILNDPDRGAGRSRLLFTSIYDGALEDARIAFEVGLAIANADAMPTRNPGDEFEAARKKALADVAAGGR